MGKSLRIQTFTKLFQGSTMKPLVRLLEIRLANQLEGGAYKLFIEFNRGVSACTISLDKKTLLDRQQHDDRCRRHHWASRLELLECKQFFLTNVSNGKISLQNLFSHISHKWIRPFVQNPETRRFKHGGLVAVHEESQLKYIDFVSAKQSSNYRQNLEMRERHASMRVTNQEGILDAQMDAYDAWVIARVELLIQFTHFSFSRKNENLLSPSPEIERKVDDGSRLAVPGTML